jgi:hypothetical protein
VCTRCLAMLSVQQHLSPLTPTHAPSSTNNIACPLFTHPPFACAGDEGTTTLIPGQCVKKASGDWLW